MLLKNVDLVCVDSVNVKSAQKAIEYSCKEIEFNNVIFVNSPKIQNIDDYNLFMLYGIPQLIKSEFILVIQWDGFIINPKSWNPEFLKYDYIGAPWPHTPKGYRVGNGGFSLRSKKLYDKLLSLGPIKYTNEASTIGILARNELTAKGVKYSPEKLAEHFSFEMLWPIGKPLGFHGVFNFFTLPDKIVIDLLQSLDTSRLENDKIRLLLRHYFSMGKWDMVEIITHYILHNCKKCNEEIYILNKYVRNNKSSRTFNTRRPPY